MTEDKLSALISEVKKGCGIDIFGNARPYSCGIEKNTICDVCQAKLQALTQAKTIQDERDKEILENESMKDRKVNGNENFHLGFEAGKRVGKQERDKEINEIIDKFMWKMKDVDNKRVEEAKHYSGDEVFMDMHNEDLEELKQALKQNG